MASCSRPPPRPSVESPPIPSTSAPRSDSWPSSTPGARTCNTTPTYIASCPEEDSRLTVRTGSPAGRGSSSRSAFDRGKLTFHGKLAPLADPGRFQRRLAEAAKTEWVVHAKPPFGGPEQVLKYLARYTHRAAISNRR